MLIKKTETGYSISGGLSWIPLLPGKIKTRKELDDYLVVGKNPRTELSYATEDYKPAKLFEVYWFNGKYAQAKEDENKTLVMDLPPYATETQITDYLNQRAKTKFNKEAVIKFIEPRPEPPEPDTDNV